MLSKKRYSALMQLFFILMCYRVEKKCHSTILTFLVATFLLCAALLQHTSSI